MPPRRSSKHPGRILHISKDDTPEVPRYADALLRSRSANADHAELGRVVSKLEELLLIPRAKVPSIVIDALYMYAELNQLDLPFSEYTRSRNEEDKEVQRYLHWHWREVEKKRR